MAYCSKTDLENVAGVQVILDLTDDEKAGSSNPEIAGRVGRAVSDADAVINGHLRAHYDVPVAAPIPDLLRKLSEDLSLFNLFSRRASGLEVPEHVRDKRADAMKMLQAIRDGKMDLGVEPPPTESSAEVAVGGHATQLFTSSTLEEF